MGKYLWDFKLYRFILCTKMDKKKENIGELKDKVLLFGGVYSNLQALEAIAGIAKKEGIKSENCICTGDIIGYCAQPEETISFFQNHYL